MRVIAARGRATLVPAGQGSGGEKNGRTTRLDVHIGSRIRLRRKILGLSQQQLGAALGITFQQLQKYERGVNRVTASRLWDLARVLDVPIGFFFDAVPDTLSAVAVGFRPLRASPAWFSGGPEADLLNRRETLELMRAFDQITDPAVRERVLQLIKSLATADKA